MANGENLWNLWIKKSVDKGWRNSLRPKEGLFVDGDFTADDGGGVLITRGVASG